MKEYVLRQYLMQQFNLTHKQMTRDGWTVRNAWIGGKNPADPSFIILWEKDLEVSKT